MLLNHNQIGFQRLEALGHERPVYAHLPLLIGPDGKITDVNKATEAVIGYPTDDRNGRCSLKKIGSWLQ